MNLNPPKGKIEDNKASNELRNNLEPKETNGMRSQQEIPASCSASHINSTELINMSKQSKPTTNDDKLRAETPKAKGIFSFIIMLDTSRAITYPFNWEQSFKKKMTNTELFTNKVEKKAKQYPFKTIFDDSQKESFYPLEFLQWNKMQFDQNKEMAKNKNGFGNQSTPSSQSLTPQMMPKQKQDKEQIGTGIDYNKETDNDICKNSNTKEGMNNKYKECYLDLLIESANVLINKGLKLNTLKDYDRQEQVISNEKSLNSTDYISRSPNNQKDKSEQKDSSALPTTASSIQFFQKKCENKICPVTVNKMSNIHQAKISTSKNKMVNLCSQCYKAWKNGQFCFYCGVIYREYSGTKGFNESKMWVACEFCKNWEHLACEEQKGVYPNLSKLIKDLKFKYDCPSCRKKKKEKEELLLKMELQSKEMSLTQSLLQKRNRDYYNNDFRKMSNPLKRKCVSSSLYST